MSTHTETARLRRKYDTPEDTKYWVTTAFLHRGKVYTAHGWVSHLEGRLGEELLAVVEDGAEPSRFPTLEEEEGRDEAAREALARKGEELMIDWSKEEPGDD